MMSPTLQRSVSQIRESVPIDTSSSFDNLAIVAVDAPIARRRSVLFIFLSINNFQSLLYDTFTVYYKPFLFLFAYYITVEVAFLQ